jgi:transketolase
VGYSIKELEVIAKKLRYNIVKMIGPCKSGHLGGSCSLADIVAVLYFYKMKIDPKNPKMECRDRFILSKGHSALVQYAALAQLGFFPKAELGKLKQLGSVLQGHPDMHKVPGVEANTGSLGQGLSIAAGMAAAAKLDKMNYKVYCVIGDGELAEGQIWEAAMAASFYKLDNLIAILDKNRLQATGFIEERFDTNPYAKKWKAFGWEVIECDGHSIPEIIEALDKADEIKNKPTLILANTVKGKGVPFAENVAAFHNGAMSQEQYELALSKLTVEGGVGHDYAES